VLMPQERFWKFVDKRGPDECWEWTGNVSHNGYGQLRGATRNATVRAHRLSYEMHVGPIPSNLLCLCQGNNRRLHKCDNPKCVNPNHLFLGNQFENIQDKMRKGRAATGVRHGRAKLNPEKVREARLLRAQGWTYRKIAERFAVSEGAIHHTLFYGINWRDVR